MKILLLLFALCLPASAATLPFPKVKRPQPLLSPKHASVLKAAPMQKAFSPAGGGSVNPRLPMKAYCVAVTNSPYGHMEFTAEALQPANKSVLFEMSPDMSPDSWVTLAWFGPYAAGQVFAMLNSDADFLFIRATAGVEPSAGMSRVVVASPLGIRVNPDVRGVRAWRGAR